jgi:hypothetical protein
MLETNEAEVLLQQIENPKGEIVSKSKHSKQAKSSFSNFQVERTEQETLLILFIQELLELAEFAQTHIQADNPKKLSRFDYERLQSGIRLLQENLDQINPQPTRQEPNFIDVEVIDV